jgi:DNA-binding IclR family transcriptional regulator
LTQAYPSVIFALVDGIFHSVKKRDEQSLKVQTLKDAADTSLVGPVERVLRLLACFNAQKDGLSLTDLAQQTHLAPSTASRLLKVLEQYTYVHRGADRLYRLGPQVVQLGLVALRGMSLYETARPHLRILAEETGESVQLGVLTGTNVLYVDQVSSQRLVQATSWVGRTVPVDNTAIGAAIQGHVCPAGYTATRHTVDPDVSSAAAPVFDQSGTIVGAINVIGPTYRISDEQLAQIGLLVAEHARQISSRLGASQM